MRIILLGSEEGGKTSSGNTILGRKEFALKKSAKCIKKHGIVLGWQINIIDTPGRKRAYLASETPQLYKDEVVLSVAHCPPGPHALLLVIKITCSFEDVCKQAVEEHLKLFGEDVWNHIIVLFTHGDQLEDETIEQHIEEQGEPLQKLLEKCGNRYHVFNNMVRDNKQVLQLLQKIEQMVDQNRGRYYEISKRIQELMGKREEQVKKAKKRMSPGPKENLQSKADLRLVLLGHQCSGKSSAGEIILGAAMFGIKTAVASVARKSKVFGRQVMVIDTQGWSKDGFVKNTSAGQIKCSPSLCPPGPHAFLLVIPVDTTFTENDEKSIIDHLGLFREEVWQHVIVLFTYADWMGDTAIEMYIESEGEALQRVLDKCGNRYHALNNMDVYDITQVRELLEKIDGMVNNSSYFAMDSNGSEKMKSESLQEEVKKQISGKDMTVISSSSSGYGSCASHKSSRSLDDPPVMSKTEYECIEFDYFSS